VNWLEERLERGYGSLHELVELAGRDPSSTWDTLTPDRRSDVEIAELLTAAIAKGLAYRPFPTLVASLASTINDELPPGALRLSRLRTLTWATAIALSVIDRYEEPAGGRL
jgi:hypothetical protein